MILVHPRVAAALPPRIPRIWTVAQDVVQDLLGLLERGMAPLASGLAELRRPTRLLPPGFATFGAAGLLFVAAAGAQQLVHEHKRSATPAHHRGGAVRHRTNLRNMKRAYAARAGRVALPLQNTPAHEFN